MEQKLRNILHNPFLRQNPFRPHQPFYSAPKTYNSQTYPLQQHHPTTYKNYLSLSTSSSVCTLKNGDSMNNNYGEKNGGKLKKSGNPFLRKNLIRGKGCDDDEVQMYDYKAQFDNKNANKLERPQFLKAQCENRNTIECDMYRDLSYKAPGTGSKNYISLDPKPNSTQKLHFSGKENPNKNDKTMTSPRFPSVKILESRQNNKISLIPPLQYRTSLNNSSVGAYSKQNTKRSQKDGSIGHSRRNSGNFCSQKEISNRNYYEKQPERDIDCEAKRYREPPADGKPKEIKINNTRYYRIFVYPFSH